MAEWDGKDRRKHDHEIYDVLSSLDKNLALLTQSYNTLGDSFKSHVLDDKEAQKKLADAHTEIMKKVEPLQTFHWKMLGGAAVASFVFAIVIKLWIK